MLQNIFGLTTDHTFLKIILNVCRSFSELVYSSIMNCRNARSVALVQSFHGQPRLSSILLRQTILIHGLLYLVFLFKEFPRHLFCLFFTIFSLFQRLLSLALSLDLIYPMSMKRKVARSSVLELRWIDLLQQRCSLHLVLSRYMTEFAPKSMLFTPLHQPLSRHPFSLLPTYQILLGVLRVSYLPFLLQPLLSHQFLKVRNVFLAYNLSVPVEFALYSLCTC